MCINVYYQQVHFHSVVFVLPGVISLFTLLSPAGGWTLDTGQMTAHAYFILSCPLSRTKLPMVHQLMNVILWSAAGQARPDRAATRRLCPHRPAPARLSQTAGGTPAPPHHPHPVLGGGRPRSSIHSVPRHTALLYQFICPTRWSLPAVRQSRARTLHRLGRKLGFVLTTDIDHRYRSVFHVTVRIDIL